MFPRALQNSKVSSDINVTPMADIMLVLLIIFMIATPLLQNEVTVNLPKARNPLETKVAEPLVLSLTREGRIYLGKTLLTEQEMAEALSERLAEAVDKRIYLRADQAMTYGNVVRFVNECRRLGVEQMALMTEQEARSNGPDL